MLEKWERLGHLGVGTKIVVFVSGGRFGCGNTQGEEKWGRLWLIERGGLGKWGE